MSVGGEFILLAVLLGVSGFFSGSETSLFSLSGADLDAFRKGTSSFARKVRWLVGAPRRTLAAILLGNQFVNVAFFAVSAQLLIKLKALELNALAMTAAAIAPLAVLVIAGEILPKNIAIAMPRSFAVLCAWPLYVIVRVLTPLNIMLVAIVEPLTRLITPDGSNSPARLDASELHRLVELSEQRGLLGSDESRWMAEVMRLGDRSIDEIMVHRVDMVSFDIAGGRDKLKALFAKTSLAKIPVYREDPDNIMGFIYARRLILEPSATLDSLVVEALFVPEQASIEQLLIQLRLRKTQIAIVVDEYGGVAGLVTLEDAIEQVVGQLETEGEVRRRPVRELSEGKFLVDASLSLKDWSAIFGQHFDTHGVTTIGGAVTELLDRMPEAGDTLTVDELLFRVGSVSGGRIITLDIELAKAEGGDQ